MPPLARFTCYSCRKEWSVRNLLERPQGYLCHKCYNALAYENLTAPRGPSPSAHHARIKRYKLTPQQFEAMLAEQNNACAICLGTPPEGVLSLFVDHNHDTGQVRGLLCGACNSALGLLQDDPDLLERGLQYLTQRGDYAKSRVGRPPPARSRRMPR